MRIAWVTHREWGEKGGAEAADFNMVERRPDDVTEITLVGPGGVRGDLAEYDRVVVTGIYGFSDRELNTLADLKPVWWVHDIQFAGHFLIESCKTVILLTPQHAEFEMEKSPLLRKENVVLNPGWMSMNHLAWPTEPNKQDWALWAHRPEAHKGLDRATEWATDKGVNLVIATTWTREVVRQAMQEARWFVLLSHIFDPGPHSIIEAQLNYCELIIDNVGYWEEPVDKLASRVSEADKKFWEVVLA